jgi:aminoglycoside phosphotransferase (APT) family kinase protein
MEKQRSTEGPPSVLTEFEVKKSANLCRLNWLQNLYGVEPQWDAEPDMEIIEETVSAVLREALPVGLDDPQIYPIEFFAQGALNKVFLIPTKDKDFIVRVTLPVDPMWKTLSEVSTLEWIRENTSLPVPDILHYDHTRENPIHYEYMVMTRVIGTTLADRWYAGRTWIDISAQD